ncbi:hypothetical protein DY000_02017049 [Brassica cretica]|uniref:Uncharacterized protein n=1 Tax=Brassica cretica TaxID=69181 RepID=A0ABQ7CNW2_BRACR|nr:hypothetical protein DY000_02017049 [Brassica cretica]
MQTEKKEKKRRRYPFNVHMSPFHCPSLSHEGFNYLNKSLLLRWNEDDVLSLKLFLPQFEDVTCSVSFIMKLYLPQYEDITLWCTSFLPLYEVIWTFALVVLVPIVSGSLTVHVKILPTDSVNGMWFKALKSGGSSLAKEAIRMLEALQSAKTHRLSSLPLILDSIVIFFAMRSWLDMIKIACLLFRNLVILFTQLSCSFNQCTATCFDVAFTLSVVSKLCSRITLF